MNKRYTLDEIAAKYTVTGIQKRFNLIPWMKDAPTLEGLCGPLDLKQQ
jgi:hypothetical protein